jgi:hypothetical protein
MRKLNFNKKILLIGANLVLGLIFVFFTNCHSGAFEAIDFPSSATGLGSLVGNLSSKGNPFVCTSPNDVSVTPLRRLTRDQYANTLLAVLGSGLFSQLTADINTLPADVLQKNVSDFSASIQDTQMTAYQGIAEKVYQMISTNDSAAQGLAGSCISASPVPPACRDEAIKNLGLQAFRRPLTTDEFAKFRDQVFALGTSGKDGLALTLYTFLLSPDFLFKVEVGEAADPSTDATFKLTSYEIASRLSYTLWSAPPDQTLYSAAANDSLKNPDQLAAQIDRMLADPRAEQKMSGFFQYWLNPRKFSAASFSPDFLQGLDVAAANTEFERELNEYVDYIVWQKKGSFTDLLTSPLSFARTPAVAAIYGHAPVTDSSMPATMSGRRKGLLMRGSVLATEGNETHPILRGVKFRSRFLCATLGLPSGVMTNVPQFFSDLARTQSSTRVRTTGLTSSNACMACHGQINPFGFAFENFDGMGRFRTEERAFSTAGTLLATHAIDTQVDGLVVDPQTSLSAHDGYDVIDDLVEGTQASACFVEQISRYYKIQLEQPQDSCLFSAVYDKIRGSGQTPASIVGGFKQFLSHPSVMQRRFQ